ITATLPSSRPMSLSLQDRTGSNYPRPAATTQAARCCEKDIAVKIERVAVLQTMAFARFSSDACLTMNLLII
ncbi:MAG TPA: hypothetical protein VNY53_17290, partial [Bradyrhizobium sp.]|nr:hypothetical protein [Bradyrhizobium sp.]